MSSVAKLASMGSRGHVWLTCWFLLVTVLMAVVQRGGFLERPLRCQDADQQLVSWQQLAVTAGDMLHLSFFETKYRYIKGIKFDT